MSAKLRFGYAAGLALALVGCEAEPLSPLQEARLERIFSELPERNAAGVVQNLRFGGLYEGSLTLDWSATLAEAINQAYFDLDFVDEKYDLNTDGGAAAFLQDLSSVSIRSRLASELSVEPAEFVQTMAPDTEAVRDGRACRISGGTYSRNGEQMHVWFYRVGGQAGLSVLWNGWPGRDIPRIVAVRFGDQSVPMLVEYELTPPLVEATLFNVNGHWVTDAMKRATEMELGQGSEIAPLLLPTGDLYQTAMALEACG